MSNEFKIGLMAIVCIAITFWGYNFLRGRNVLKASNSYYVRYDDIDQLAVSSPMADPAIDLKSTRIVSKEDRSRTAAMTKSRLLAS